MVPKLISLKLIPWKPEATHGFNGSAFLNFKSRTFHSKIRKQIRDHPKYVRVNVGRGVGQIECTANKTTNKRPEGPFNNLRSLLIPKTFKVLTKSR